MSHCSFNQTFILPLRRVGWWRGCRVQVGGGLLHSICQIVCIPAVVLPGQTFTGVTGMTIFHSQTYATTWFTLPSSSSLGLVLNLRAYAIAWYWWGRANSSWFWSGLCWPPLWCEGISLGEGAWGVPTIVSSPDSLERPFHNLCFQKGPSGSQTYIDCSSPSSKLLMIDNSESLLHSYYGTVCILEAFRFYLI